MTDDPRDETQALSPVDEPTRMIPASDEPTRAIANPDEATRRIDAPGPGEIAEPTRRIDAPPPSTRRMDRQAVAASPPTERIVLPDATRGVGAWLIALIVVLALVVGGFVGYEEHGPSGRGVVARALVSSAGGVMPFDGVGKLIVPSGALPTPTAITIRRQAIQQRVRLGTEGDAGAVSYDPGELVVYAFEPADLHFQQPVTIELPRSGDASAVFIDARGSPRVIQGAPSGDVVKVRTTSFAFDDAVGAGG
jgi:hypothetical protein